MAEPAQLITQMPGIAARRTLPNDWNVLRSRRVATRIWCTESGSSRRTMGSSAFRFPACSST